MFKMVCRTANDEATEVLPEATRVMMRTGETRPTGQNVETTFWK